MQNRDVRGRETVRELARRVAELAQSDQNQCKHELWRDVNSLRKPRRAPIRCEVPLYELIPSEAIVSCDAFHREVERRLRGWLWQWELGDDTVLPDYIDVPLAVRLEGEFLWGVPVQQIHPTGKTNDSSETSTAWHYDPPIKSEADIDRIRPPRYRHDVAETQRDLDRMQDLVGDILRVRPTAGDGYQLHGLYGAWLHGHAMALRGIEQFLIDLMDRPRWVHRLMQVLMEGYEAAYDQFEAMNVLTLNNVDWLACDDLPQSDFDPGHVRLKDLWGRSESQEFHVVSPAQYDEFLLQYQKPLLERFGVVLYGCCEDLTRKIDLVLSIPNLRRFVCSAWTSLERVVEATGDRYTIEWRQLATDIIFSTDLARVRKHLDRGLGIAQGSRILIALREVETVAGRPERLLEWVKIAKEVAENHAP
jgi:hypothetical protein